MVRNGIKYLDHANERSNEKTNEFFFCMKKKTLSHISGRVLGGLKSFTILAKKLHRRYLAGQKIGLLKIFHSPFLIFLTHTISWLSSERFMYVQFTSDVQWERLKNIM